MQRALHETVVEGIKTTIPYHLKLLADPAFVAGGQRWPGSSRISKGAAVRLPSPLYAILDRSVSHGRDLPVLLEAILGGGGRLVQLREKTMPLADLLPLAQRLARRCREVGALFLVNDRADLALAAGADGLHVGQDDLPARRARQILRRG